MRRAILYVIILIFICMGFGLITGIAIERAYTKRNLPKIIKKYYLNIPSEQRQKARIAKILKRLRAELQLSDEQAVKIENILNQIRPEINQIKKGVTVRLIEIRQRAIIQASEVLNNEQKIKLKKIFPDNMQDVN